MVARTGDKEDHPRSRGVYASAAVALRDCIGSSPLARGLRRWSRTQINRSGIIPARAGFTANRGRAKSITRDHPRSRGVYERIHRMTQEALGSSPLARGLPVRGYPWRYACWIIPARAGFTRGVIVGDFLPGDHPRSRGVYRMTSLTFPIAHGSSPLARGLRRSSRTQINRSGIIPARAGFTADSASSDTGHSDHPRSRGVYCLWVRVRGDGGGSSPLARGLLREFEIQVAILGIIPARAGFTLADRWYPNEPVVYQTPAAFTADPGPAPPGRRSVAVVRGGASPLPDVLDATRPPRVFPAPVREPLRHAQTSGSVIRLEADRVDRADPHRHERGDDPRQGSDPGCRHQSDERGGHGEGRVVRHRDI